MARIKYYDPDSQAWAYADEMITYPVATQGNNGLMSVADKIALDGVILKVENIILEGTSDPTTSTAGSVGQFYKNTTDGTFFMCTAVSGGTYTWSPSALNLTYSVVSTW